MSFVNQHVPDGTAVTATITIPFSGTQYPSGPEYLDVVITAVTGTTPTLTASYQTWNSGSLSWTTVHTTSTLNAAGTTRIAMTQGAQVPSQVVLTVGGTSPHYTMGVHHTDV